MKSNYIIGLLSLLTILISQSCEPVFYDRIIGDGDQEIETRLVRDFNEVTHNGSFNIYVKQDTLYELEVEADDNLLPYIETYVRGDELIIETEAHKRLISDNPIKVFVTMPAIEKLKLTGSGGISADYFVSDNLEITLTGSGEIYFDADADITDITTTGSGDIDGKLYTDKLTVDVTGSGDVELEGEANESDYVITGTGDIKSFDLPQKTNYSRITGTGDIRLTVEEYLEVTITGTGSLFYKGNPTVKQSITGTGSVRNYNK